MKAEFITSICIQILTAGVFIGGLAASIKFLEKQISQNKTDITKSLDDHKHDIKEDIARLERKQDKHNNLIERMCVVEQSNKSLHHRQDEANNRLNEICHRLDERR